MNYKEIAEKAVEYAGRRDIMLDFSKESIEDVDFILGWYHEHLKEYEGEAGANTLWNLAFHFGIYLGETMLLLQLKEKGYEWHITEGIPVLRKNDSNTEISPVTKAHKRIQNGFDDSVKSFCDVAFLIADGQFPTQDVLRVVDVQLSSGQTAENVLFRNIGSYIKLIETREEDFLVLKSHDGFLKIYGMVDQFAAEIHINLTDGNFSTYSIIDKEKEHATDRESISVDLVRIIIEKYYKNLRADDFLRDIPCILSFR